MSEHIWARRSRFPRTWDEAVRGPDYAYAGTVYRPPLLVRVFRFVWRWL